MALLQIRRGNNGTKGTLQYGEPFFNSSLQTVQFGASGSEEITLVKLNQGLAGDNTWGSASVYENSGSLSLTGDITASNAYFRGNVIVSGNLRLGDSNVDSVTVVADFTSDLIPDVSGTFNLGSLTKYWNTAYLGSLSLAALGGADAPNNIVFVNSGNQLTASNDFEFIEGSKLRLGSGSQDRFWVESNTGNTFLSGNLYVSGTNGITLKGNVSSSEGYVTAVSAAFDNLRQGSGGSNDAIVIASNGYLYNTSDLRFVGDGLDIGNNKFTVNKTNGNIFSSGTLHVLQQISGSSQILTSTLQVGGAANFLNQVNVATELVVTNNIRANGSGSFGSGLNVAGPVTLNVGNAGFVMISGSTQLGDDPQNDSVSISGSINHLYTGTAQQNLFRRYSAVRSSSLVFTDDNSGGNPGEVQLTVTNITDPTKNGQLFIADNAAGVTLSSGSTSGVIYLDTTAGKNNAYIDVTDDIYLNPGTGKTLYVRERLVVTGSTILGQGGDDLLTVASPTTMSGDVWNQGYTANLGTVRISSSLTVSGSTQMLGTVTMGDLRTQSGSGILGSASFDSDVRVGRDLYVNGTRASFKPKLVELASGSTIASQAEGAGIYISGAAASFVYQEAGNRFANSVGLKINGGTALGRSLEVSGSTYMTGGLEVSGNLAVYGNINLGNVTITNTASIQELVVNNNISGGNNLNLANNASISGNLYVFGTETVNGTLKANSATAIHSTLNVSGAVGFNNVLRVTGSTSITGGLFVSGNTELSSSLTVKEYSFFEKNMRVSGNLQVDGNVDILGDVVQIQVSNLQVEDKNVIIASGSLSSLQSDGGGLTILGPTNPIQFTWEHSNQRMNLNKDLNVSGNLFVLGDNIIDTATALAIALG